MTVALVSALAAMPAVYLLGRRDGRKRERRRWNGAIREAARIESLRQLPKAAPGRPRPRPQRAPGGRR